MAMASPSRSSSTRVDIVHDIWQHLGLPQAALQKLSLPGDGLGFPSSFRIADIAQASIGLSALTAALIYSVRNDCDIPKVTVPRRHACAEYKCEVLYFIEGEEKEHLWGPLGGLHKTSDGHVRIHDGFPHHRDGALKLLGLEVSATRDAVTRATLIWKALELERAAIDRGLVIVSLRTYDEWDALPQAKAVPDFPVFISKLGRGGTVGLPWHMRTGSRKALDGLRVLELSRVIAAPVAGKTLAQHGADVLWVTSPNLPDQPVLDREFSRGKRNVRLDLDDPDDAARLRELVRDADVFIQGYRPGSLAARGFSPNELAKINPNLIYASLCAYGNVGPWSGARGFDSLVQTCSGMNASEAEHYGDGSPARPMPCQALDHTAGFMLATGVMAALYQQAMESGSCTVDVSLVGCMRYLRSLGQYEGKSGFACENITDADQVQDLMDTKSGSFGNISYVRHSADIEGVEVGSARMPVPSGSDAAAWL